METLILVLKFLGKLFIFPGFFFCFFAGLTLAGIDRKVVARMQRRIGPPIIQPFYDFFKLLGKETIIPRAAARKAFLAAPVIGLVSLITVALFIPMFNLNVFDGVADMIVIVYLLTIASVALVIGGSASGSPFAGVGISREVVAMLSYELPFVIVLLTIGKKVGFALNDGLTTFSLTQVIDYQAKFGPMISKWSMIPAMIAMLFVIPCEVGSLPFDIAEAETEICEGPLVEYSGPPLAIFKLNHAIKMLVMSSLFVTLFLSGAGFTFTGSVLLNTVLNVLLQLILCVIVVVISMSLLRASLGRLKVEQTLKFFWTYPTVLALISFVLVYVGL